MVADIYKNNVAVSGKSLLTSALKVLNPDINNCTFLEYKSFCDFIEAVILHDNIIILGPFTDMEFEISDWVKVLNEKSKQKFIHIEDITQDKLVPNDDVDILFKEILSSTFQSNQIEFVRHQLFQKSPTNRYTDDEKDEYLREFVTLFRQSDSNEIFFENFQEFLSASFKNHRHSEFNKYIFRAFLIAAYAKSINGTALFTGARKPIGTLIKYFNSNFRFQTLPYVIYRYANSIFLKEKEHLFFQDKTIFSRSLLLSIIINKSTINQDITEVIFDLRNEFKKYRDRLNAKDIELISSKKKKGYNMLKNQAFRYFDERRKLLSNNNFKNLGKKYWSELIFDSGEVEMQAQRNVDSSGQEDSSNPSVTLNIITMIKNGLKFIRDYFVNIRIKFLTKPLGSYLCENLNRDDISSTDNIINVKEYHFHDMKELDKFTYMHNI